MHHLRRIGSVEQASHDNERQTMITGAIKSQVNQIWNAFWSGGVSNPLSVIEQITYLLFIKRLDEIHTREEAKATMLQRPMERRIFPEGTFRYKLNDDPQDDTYIDRPYDDLRWQRLINFESREKMKLVDLHVFPFLRNMAEEGSSFATHMKDARLGFSSAALLDKVMRMLDSIQMDDRDTKGDVYEYMLAQIASAGQNGQFRTPRHIINLMVHMMAPTPKDVICDPAAGTCGFLVLRANTCATNTLKCCATPRRGRISIATCSTPLILTPPCCGLAR